MEGTEMTSSRKIGEDLLVKTLSTLPPKTLMRFKCVAKWWHALINNPRFIDNHLSNSNSMHNSIHEPTFVFINRLLADNPRKPRETEDPNFSTFSKSDYITSDPRADKTESVFSVLTFRNVVDNDDGSVHSCLSGVEDISIPLPMRLEIGGDSKSLRIIGHCDGIICLAFEALGNSRKVFLWNPVIQEFKLLPSETHLPDCDFLLGSQRWHEGPYIPSELYRLDNAIGFGYDPISKGYKVFNVIFAGSTMHADGKYVVVYPLRAGVYTLGTNSWREIKTYSLETETTYLWPERFQIYFKGVCYWCGTEQHKEFIDLYDTRRPELEKIRNVIVSFDMSDEVFHDVLLPDELLESNNFEVYLDMRLTVWNESVALFGIRFGPIGFGMWLMDDYGSSKGVWTKHLDFVLETYPLDNSLALWKSDEVLLVSRNGSIVCYNLCTKNFKYLPIQIAYAWSPMYAQICYKANHVLEDGYLRCDHAPVVYVNSIVSVSGGNKLES